MTESSAERTPIANEPGSVLIVSAQPQVRRQAILAVRGVCRAESQITPLATAAAALSLPNLAEVELAIVDHLLADVPGIDLVDRLVEACREPTILFVHDESDQAAADAAIQSGAFEAVLIDDLVPAAIARIWTRARRAEFRRRDAEAEMRRLADENAELNQMMRALSHDLRANMMLLGDSFQHLRENVPTSSLVVTDDAEHVEACLQQSQRLLDDLAELAKTGQVDMQPQAVAVGPLAQQVMFEQNELLRQRNIQATVHDRLPTVWCHSERLAQLMTNLIRNAALHGCDSQQGRIDVIPLQSIDDGLCRFAICDNGPGIPTEFAQQVFQAGERLDAQSEGTGMGLAIVRRIANHFGGDVTVDTQFVGGTRMVVTLPSPPTMAGESTVIIDSQSAPTPSAIGRQAGFRQGKP